MFDEKIVSAADAKFGCLVIEVTIFPGLTVGGGMSFPLIPKDGVGGFICNLGNGKDVAV